MAAYDRMLPLPGKLSAEKSKNVNLKTCNFQELLVLMTLYNDQTDNDKNNHMTYTLYILIAWISDTKH